MKHVLTVGLVLCLTATASATYTVTIDFEDPVYAPGNLAGQDGWGMVLGADATMAQVVTDNGPTLPGSQAVDVYNFTSEIRLQKSISDVVALGGPRVTFQYDIKDNLNIIDLANPDVNWSTTLFRTRLYDSGNGVAAVGNMHYDGGAGPACQAYAYDEGAMANGYAPGGPAWLDVDWHTVSWTFNYATHDFVEMSFDGTVFPQPGWTFADWPPEANTADLLSMWLQTYDNNDWWTIDNFIITATPEPASLALLALGGLAVLRRRR